MARVHQSAASARAARSRGKATGHRKRPYKVILESITQEKKKLYTVISFEAEAPPGYTFIPAGNPHLTNRCKELAREHGVKVLIVSTTPHKNHKSTLSHQVHRIGHHFPSWIVGQACMDLGLHISRLGHVIRTYHGEPEHGVQKSQRKRKNSAGSDVSQAILNAEARDAIKDLFPKIPEADLNKIISRAFQKGKSRVGTASELSLPRRVQLAVVAHIRHVYTNYDRLLRTGTYHAARAQIEQKCLDQLVQWRGDGEDGSNDMEEILREVIVISDDEDDDADSITNNSLVPRDSSVEIISSHALADDVQVRPVDYRYRPVAIEDDPPSAVDYTASGILQHADRTYQGDEQRAKERFGRRGFSRYRAWDQALDRYRKAPYQNVQRVREAPMGSGSKLNARPQSAYGYRLLEDTAQASLGGTANGHYAQVRGRTASMEDSRLMHRPSTYHRPQSPPEYLETELQSPVIAREAGYPLAFRPQVRSVQDDAYLDSAAKPAKIVHTSSERKLDREAIPSSWQQQDHVLPSIEGPTHHVDSSMVRRSHNKFSTRLIEREIQPHAAQQNLPILIRSGHSPVMPRILDLDEYGDNHLAKRRRVTDLAYRQSNPVPAVTSKLAQTGISGSRPSRVEWIESDLSSRRPAQRDTVRLFELQHGSHDQRNGRHSQVQTIMDSPYHHGPCLRSSDDVDTDYQYQDLYHAVSRSNHGELARDSGYAKASSGQRADRTHVLLRSRVGRLPAHRTEQYDASFSADELLDLHEADRTSHSTQLVRARSTDEDHTNVYPMYSADSQTNTRQAMHYVRISDGDQSRPVYIKESVQLTPGNSARHEGPTRDDVMRAKEYVDYDQTLEDEQYAGKPYPVYRRPAANQTQRPPVLTSEFRKVENDRPQSSYYYTYGNATEAQPLLRAYPNNTTQQASSEDISDLPSYLPLRAEQKRYVRADRPDVDHGRDLEMAGQHPGQAASPLRRATDRDGRSYEPHPSLRPRREVIVLD